MKVVAGVLLFLLISSTAFGRTLFFKNGEELECVTAWVSKETVRAKVNNDILLDFPVSEIDLMRSKLHYKGQPVNPEPAPDLPGVPVQLVGRRKLVVLSYVKEDGRVVSLSGMNPGAGALIVSATDVSGVFPTGEKIHFGQITKVEKLKKGQEVRVELTLDDGTHIQFYHDTVESSGKMVPVLVAMMVPEKGGKLMWMLKR